MKKGVWVGIFTVLVFASSCNLWAGGFIDVKDLKKIIGKEWLPSAEDYPDADYIMLYESHNVDMKIDNNGRLYTDEEIHIIKRLLKDIESNATVVIRIYHGQKLADLEARTIKANGSIVKLKKSDVYEISGEDSYYVLYSDVKKHKFTFSGAEKNDIIEYRFTIRKEHAFFNDEWTIQRRGPTLYNTYQLVLPEFLLTQYHWNWRFKAYNYSALGPYSTDSPNPFEKGREKKKRYAWTLRDIPEFKDEPMMPPEELHKAYMLFAPGDWGKWEDIAKWYNQYVLKDLPLSDNNVVQQAADLSKDASSQMEKAARCYQWVQQLRYVAVSMKESGLRPTAPAKVMEKKHGDCKDKSMLLIALLKALGIEARPVLVSTADIGGLDVNFPHWAFNHMIVKAVLEDGNAYWLDPTVKYAAFGELPADDENISTLVLDSDSTCSIEKTPASKCADNRTEYDIDINISPTYATHFSIKVSYFGKDAINARYLFEDNGDKEMREHCKSIISGDYVDADINQYTIVNQDSVGKELVFSFDFNVNNSLQQQGDLQILRHEPIPLVKSYSWLKSERRKYPVEYGYPHTVIRRYRITYPNESLTVRNHLKNFHTEGPSLYYRSIADEETPGKMIVEETYRVVKKTIGPEFYNQLLRFYNELQTFKNDRIIFTKKA